MEKFINTHTLYTHMHTYTPDHTHLIRTYAHITHVLHSTLLLLPYSLLSTLYYCYILYHNSNQSLKKCCSFFPFFSFFTLLFFLYFIFFLYSFMLLFFFFLFFTFFHFFPLLSLFPFFLFITFCTTKLSQQDNFGPQKGPHKHP